jgi:hypothetical protein
MNKRLDRSLVKNTLALGLWIVTSALLAACWDEVTIGPRTPVFTVAGTVSGLPSGGTLVLQNNADDMLTVYSNGAFVFPSEVGPGSTYTVTVNTQPAPPETCTVNGGSGTVATNVASVKVTCAVSLIITAAGTPSGAATSAVIGPGGGSLSSSDSRMTLTVPAGALTTDTSVSIQPISNNAPGGVGSAYRLSPDGQTFVSPVELTWNYTTSDLSATAPDFLAISYQDAQGHWLRYTNGLLDTQKGTFTISTVHFTDFSDMAWFQVIPSQKRLKVNETFEFGLQYCYLFTPLNGESGCYPYNNKSALCSAEQACPQAVTWAATPGQIVTTHSGDTPTAEYQAPAQVPSPNQAIVAAAVLIEHVITMPAHVTIVGNTYVGKYSISGSSLETLDSNCAPNPRHGNWSFSEPMTWDTDGDLLIKGSYEVAVSVDAGTLTLHIDGYTCTEPGGFVIQHPAVDNTLSISSLPTVFPMLTSDGTNIDPTGLDPSALAPSIVPGCSFSGSPFAFKITSAESIEGSDSLSCNVNRTSLEQSSSVMLNLQQ